MTRVDGRGPKPQIAFIDDWSALKAAIDYFRVGGYAADFDDDQVLLSSPIWMQHLYAVVHYTPMLMDAYSEAWELMNAMTSAWEKLQESKDSIYVPDAQELVQGLANPERTRR